MTLTGAYSLVSENDEMVMEAATFAFRELFSVLSRDNDDDVGDLGFAILRASKQVVAAAGWNIRLEMVFRDSAGVFLGAGTVVVYNHFGDLSITSWEQTDDTNVTLTYRYPVSS
jgi:hypothetical protein